MPSIRVLARELKVSIITCRRAYEDLCEQGILVSQPGKGVFVADVKPELLLYKVRKELEEGMKQICINAKKAGLSKQDIIQMATEAYEAIGREEQV